MSETESLAWLIERFGADGFALREKIPQLLQDCHEGMAGAQEDAPIRAHLVYGQIWKSVHEQFDDRLGSLPTAQRYRPKRAQYRLPVVNGTALFPWRYAHDSVTELEHASFGPNVSATRRELLTAGAPVPDMLPFGEITPSDIPEEEAADIERYRAQFRETAAVHPLVVVAYASNPDALLNAFWADVNGLRADGTLELGYREPLYFRRPPPPGIKLVGDDDPGPSFDGGPLQVPVISPRFKRPASAAGTDSA
jgi:hypothetical protein